MKTNWARTTLMLAGAATLAMAFSTPAKADRRVRVSVGAHGDGWSAHFHRGPAPVVRTLPVYEDVVRRVWREPIYETRRVPVHIPAETITRKVPRYSACGNFVVGWDYVEEVIRPARTEWRIEQVLIREGYYETVTERVLVRSAHAQSTCGTAIGKARPYGQAQVRRARGSAGFSFRIGD